jgi:hypothetical protein
MLTSSTLTYILKIVEIMNLYVESEFRIGDLGLRVTYLYMIIKITEI